MVATQVSINRQMDKEDVICMHNRILFSQKKNEILPFAAMWMDLENILCSEISHIKKDKYWIISLTCRHLKNKTNEYL